MIGVLYELGFCLVVVDMGCGGSKLDDLPLVIRCRERKELIKAAAYHRYALASAHVSYFASLKDVGDTLCRFVDEELLIVSPTASPVLTLPSDEGKSKKKRNKGGGNNRGLSSSTSLSHSGSISHGHLPEDDNHDHDMEDSHLHLSSGSDSEFRSSPSGHIHIYDSPEHEGPSFSSPPQTDYDPYGYPPYQTDWGPYGGNPPFETGWGPYGGNSSSYKYNTYYMKKSSPAISTVIYEEQPRRSVGTGQWPDPSTVYSSSYASYPYENEGFFGFPMSSAPREPSEKRRQSPPAGPPPPPSPKVSAWDFINPFDGYDNGYPGNSSQNRYGYGSIASSPDSNEVREREGIPDLEEETENDVYKVVPKGKKLNEDMKKSSGEGISSVVPPRKSSEGSSRSIPSHSSEGSSARAISSHNNEASTRAMPTQNKARPSQISEGTSGAVPPANSEATVSVSVSNSKSSSDTIISKSTEDGNIGKKGVSFEVDELSMHDVESSKLSSLTTLSNHGTRDLQEVVSEIRDEFETASGYGKEVAVMLEVGKLPYQPRFPKVILSRILYLKAPSSSSSHLRSRRSVRLASRTMKLAKSYYGNAREHINVKPSNLSSTLEKLYAWEKKLYKEVKDEERLRDVYEKKCKRLKVLDDQGAESSKIDAMQASVRKLLTKLNVCIKTIDAISRRIEKLRDEELKPQVTELIHGLIRMWKSVLRCHQKQFHAIMESKTQTLKANTGFRRDSSLRATLDLGMELLAWCSRFSDLINTQKSYVESLNGWLLRCLDHEPEETPDGIVPFSPGRIGAPPIFVVCNDWWQAMERISETGVAVAMRSFASSLGQLWERQDEKQRQRLKAEYLSKDFEKQFRTLQMEKGRIGREEDTMLDKIDGLLVPSESGVSPVDDLKVDLDSLRTRLVEERARHKEAVKLVHGAASTSLQGGLVPIFKALENFTLEALKAYEHVRLQESGQGS